LNKAEEGMNVNADLSLLDAEEMLMKRKWLGIRLQGTQHSMGQRPATG
jgi:hypothetical protein